MPCIGIQDYSDTGLQGLQELHNYTPKDGLGKFVKVVLAKGLFITLRTLILECCNSLLS